MAKYTGTIPNLIQGVSEQPKKERLPGQLSEQFNMVSHPVQGLARRGGAELLKEHGVYTEGTYYYTYKRDNTEMYTIEVDPDGTVRVTDKLGNPQTVNGTGDSGVDAAIKIYLTNADLTAVTLGDTTLLANRNIVPAMDATVSPAIAGSGYRHFVYFTGVEYGRVYKLYAGSTLLSSYTTPSTVTIASGEVQTAIQLDPKVAIEAIRSGWVGGTGYSISQTYANDCAVITKDSGGTVTENIYTSGGSEFTVVTNQTGKTLANLPPIAEDGMVFKIDNSKKIDEDDYYLKYQTEVASFNDQGKWVETRGPGIKYIIDHTTMPIAVYQATAGGPFTVGYMDKKTTGYHWDTRSVGDDSTNKIPSFIGKSINAMGSFQNRLYFLSEDSWVSSQTDDFWNFWKHTAIADRDDDRIDVLAPSATVNILKSSTMYNKNLVLFSEGTQYVQSGSSPLTPETVNLGVSTSYSMDLTCEPEATGDFILFCTQAGNFTKVQAFRLEDLTNLERAEPLTNHVPKYIPTGVEQIVASSALNMAAVRCGTDCGLYMFQWYMSGNDYVQQAWYKWELTNHHVKHMYISENRLYCYAKRDDSDTVDLLSIEMTTQETDNYFDVLALDNFQYIDSSDWTLVDDKYVVTPTVNLPYTDMLIVRASGSDAPGMLVNATWNASESRWETTAFASGPQPCFIGSEYKSRFKPTPPYIKNPNGEAMTDSPLLLSELILNIVNSGEMQITLAYDYHDDIVMPVNAPIVGIYQLGRWSATTGTVPVPIFGYSEDLDMTIESKLHLPMTIIDMVWKGQYNQSGRWV